MSAPKRIWIDMTDLQVWAGHMTGVQRVVYQNALRFAQSNEYDAHYFVFIPEHKMFTEVDFSTIQEQIEATVTATQESQEPAKRTLKQAVRHVPRAIIARVPSSVRQRIPESTKRDVKRAAHLSLRVARKGVRIARSSVQTKSVSVRPEQIIFTPADTVLIMGKSWDLPALIPTLGRLKQEQGFHLVHLIHDMIPILEPHLFGAGLFEPYTKCMFDVCSLSDGILTVSESTKRDVARFCKMLAIPTPPLKAVHLGDDLLDMELPEDMPAPDPRIKKGEFILHVGTIELRKNHLLVYLAYREAALRGIKMPMYVIMGAQGWMVGDLLHQIEHDPLVKDNIIILRGRPDIERLWVYKNCRFTVFPSTYEGWGMPVGESLAYGKVCITSTTASLPEVGGKYADTVSPYNSQEMLDAIVTYLDDKKLHAREQEIVKGYKPATWDGTFKDVESMVRSVTRG